MATAGSAQTPTPAGVPAKTTWQAFPAEPPSAPPLVIPSPTASPPTPPAIGTRVVVFQKPAGDDRPVARQDDPPAKNGKGGNGKAEKEKDDKPPAPKPKLPPPADPKPTDIRLLDDARLDAELLRSYNAQQLEAYNRSTDEDKKDKEKPKPTGRDQLPPSEEVRKLLAVPFPPAAPRSLLAAAPSALYLEPGYVVHRRLMFEEKNAERYGWNLGMAQPFLSAGYFYKDLLLYPMKLASNLGERYDTSAGKAMPGSPVPYLWYPPELTFGGMALGSLAYVGTVFLLP